MADREGLEAVGPADVEPGPARRFPLSGTVTIEEYTPLLMRGSFSADLVQMGERGKAGDPVLPIARTLEGRFFISQPWRTDRRVQVRNAGIAMTEMVEEAFPGISLVPGAALSVTAPPARTETPGNGAASRTSGCNCSCNYAASTNTSCRTQCEPVFAACSPVIPSAIEAATSPLDVPTAKADALEQAFIDMLRSDGSSDAAIAARLEWFRSLPDAAKSVYLESSTRK